MGGRSIGSSAGVLALIAVLMHAIGGSNSERRGGQKEAQAMPDLSVFAAHSEAKELPLVEQGPWNTTQQYFHSEPIVNKDQLAKCFGEPADSCPPALINSLYAFPSSFDRSNLNAVIATVPDPLHTRMSMETDRYLDAIQQAAFDSGFELAMQWLPWTVKAAAEKTGAVPGSTDKSFDWERLPGLLLFRHHFFNQVSDVSGAPGPDSLLLVFVVGETPTAGVNGYQFGMARATIQALSVPSSHNLYIAGPNFSGSFPSMTRLLEDSASGVAHIEMRSGAVTNDRYAAQMLTELEKRFSIDKRAVDARPSISFYASVPSSFSFLQQFKKLAGKLHIDEAQTAQIMETETGFAAIAPHARASSIDHASPIIRYPRDIAQLRNTYNDAAFASSAGQTGTASPPPVDFSLKDTQAGEDEFPTFSTNHTPISQNAVLEQIADRVKHNHIRLVALSASNVFDTLFLANFLTRNCPDTRLVLPSADLLFVEDAIAGRLSGLMAISPFPLFPEGTPLNKSGNGNDIATFASSDQTGEFNAMASLLGVMNKGIASRAAQYQQDYGPALNEGDLSSAWVLVLSSRGWMPVDLFPQPNEPLPLGATGTAGKTTQSTTWEDPSLKAKSSINDSLSGLKAGGPLWLVLCAAVVLITGLTCYRLWNLKLHPEKRVWSSFCLEDPAPDQAQSGVQPPIDCKQVLRSRYFCMNACFSNLAVANALFLCPMLANDHGAGFHYWAVLILIGAAFCWATITSVLLIRSWIPKHSRSEQTVALNVGLQLIAASTIAAWCYCCFFNGVASTMFNFRTLTLAGSVCPLWPLLLVTLGLFAMAFFQLRRFTWCDRRQPYLDTSLFDALFENEFTETRKQLETSLMSATGNRIWKATGRQCHGRLQFLAMLCWPFVLLFIVVFLLGESLNSFESRAFTYTVEGLFAILAVFTISNLFRFVTCWRILRAFLVNLNSIVLGRFFGQVSEFSGGSGPIWIRDVKLMSLSTVANGYIALHNLDQIRKSPLQPGTSDYRNALQKFLKADASSGSAAREEFVRAYRQFRQCANEISVGVGTAILREYWLKNRLDFVAVDDSEEPAGPVVKPKAVPVAETQNMSIDLGKGTFYPSWKADRLELVALRNAEHVTGSLAEESLAMSAAANSSRPRTASGNLDNAVISPAWAVNRLEFVTSSKPDNPPQTAGPSKDEYEQASRYVALHYSAYIGYILHQLQNLLIASTVCFVVLMLGLNSFAFQAPQTIFHLASASLVIGGIIILMALAQMERDPILSRLSGSKGGELGRDFYFRALAFGILPVLTVLGTEFPSIAQYVSTWIQPMSEALR